MIPVFLVCLKIDLDPDPDYSWILIFFGQMIPANIGGRKKKNN